MIEKFFDKLLQLDFGEILLLAALLAIVVGGAMLWLGSI